MYKAPGRTVNCHISYYVHCWLIVVGLFSETSCVRRRSNYMCTVTLKVKGADHRCQYYNEELNVVVSLSITRIVPRYEISHFICVPFL